MYSFIHSFIDSLPVLAPSSIEHKEENNTDLLFLFVLLLLLTISSRSFGFSLTQSLAGPFLVFSVDLDLKVVVAALQVISPDARPPNIGNSIRLLQQQYRQEKGSAVSNTNESATIIRPQSI